MTRPERTQLIGREPSPMEPGRRAAEAAWRIEWPRLIAGLTRLVGDIDAAEDLAQDALVAALQQWPREGVPPNPGAWLMLTAKHRARSIGAGSQRRLSTGERTTPCAGSWPTPSVCAGVA
jgi:predicted RNA polymerase sigma factor